MNASIVKHIRESQVADLITTGEPVQCEFVPQDDRTFGVVISHRRQRFSLISFRGNNRSFVDVVRGLDWAARMGLKEANLKVDLSTWPTD